MGVAFSHRGSSGSGTSPTRLKRIAVGAKSRAALPEGWPEGISLPRRAQCGQEKAIVSALEHKYAPPKQGTNVRPKNGTIARAMSPAFLNLLNGTAFDRYYCADPTGAVASHVQISRPSFAPKARVQIATPYAPEVEHLLRTGRFLYISGLIVDEDYAGNDLAWLMIREIVGNPQPGSQIEGREHWPLVALSIVFTEDEYEPHRTRMPDHHRNPHRCFAKNGWVLAGMSSSLGHPEAARTHDPVDGKSGVVSAVYVHLRDEAPEVVPSTDVVQYIHSVANSPGPRLTAPLFQPDPEPSPATFEPMPTGVRFSFIG